MDNTPQWMSKMCCINFNLYIPYDLAVQRMKPFGYYCRSTKKNKVHGNKYRERENSTRAIACAASCLPQYSSVLPGIIAAVQNIEINNSGFNTFIDGTIFFVFLWASAAGVGRWANFISGKFTWTHGIFAERPIRWRNSHRRWLVPCILFSLAVLCSIF